VPEPEPEQPALVIDDVTVTGSPVPGETLRVAATVENVGDLRGGRKVTLERDGESLETVEVEVDPRADRTVAFEYVVADREAGRTVRFAVDTENDREVFGVEVDGT
jgi:CARDB.